MPARREIADVNVIGDEARQQLVSLTPSTSPDCVLGLTDNDDRRISLQVKDATFVGDERSGITAGPPNPSQSGHKRGGGARGGRPPGAFGMGQLVPGMVKGVLKVLFVEPPVPHSESPVPYDSSVGFEGRVERATGAIERKEGKDRVATRGSGGSSHGDFHSGVVQAGI